MMIRARWAIGALLLPLCIALQASAQSTSGSTQTDAYKQQLQKELSDLEAQIAQQQQVLDSTKTQDASLSRDIKVLNAQIKQAQLQIEARNVVIEQLTQNVQDKEQTIYGLDAQLGGEEESLAAILREKDQLDTTPLVLAVLSSKTLSDYFIDSDAFDQVNAKLQASFTKIANTKDITQQQKDDLQAKLDEETKLREVQQLQQQQIAAQQSKKQQLLADTRGQEAAYQKLIAKGQQSASQIRAALFNLSGTKAIPFWKALDYANLASQKTGIRPAFLLGIITEESNLGENVGTGNYQTDMNPTRDVPVFLAITKSLGLDPASVPVSKKAWYGWGGAMGPAQFIPSTWALYAGYVKPDYHYDSSKDRVGKLTGHTPPNPWDPGDAFMASAIYLTDSGADAQTPSAEFHAAMCYLAGCGNANNQSLRFYGDQVAQYAAQYQCQINIIEGKPAGAGC